MEKIREYLKSFDGDAVDFQKFIYACDSKWGQLKTGLPFDMELGAALVEEYIKGRVGEPVAPVDLPIMLTKAEAVSIAKALGGNDKAEDLKDEICNAAKAITAKP